MAYENRDVLSRPELNDVTYVSMLITIKVTVPAVPKKLAPKTICGIGVLLDNCAGVRPTNMATMNMACVRDRRPIAHIIPFPTDVIRAKHPPPCLVGTTPSHCGRRFVLTALRAAASALMRGTMRYT